MKLASITAAAIALLIAAPAHAEVKATWAAGFRTEARVTVAASPDSVYAALGQIGRWWDSAHTYTGDASHMTLALEPGGCFCEAFPAGGGVKHGEVALAWPGRLLRIDAALGPLQDEGVSGALTFTLRPAAGGGTEIIQTYNVGGARPEIVGMASLVDQVISGQLTRLRTFVETGKPGL